tara:strand:- start:3388 stop:3759 length:372 start_codon:yes stop_codon:yes gene_type:complete
LLLGPFLCLTFFYLSDEILRVKRDVCADDVQKERRVFFCFFFSFSSFSAFIRHFYFFEVFFEVEDNNKKMIFNLEGLTVYFPYEYLYPVRFKRVDFLTLLFCYHFLRRASLSRFPYPRTTTTT